VHSNGEKTEDWAQSGFRQIMKIISFSGEENMKSRFARTAMLGSVAGLSMLAIATPAAAQGADGAAVAAQGAFGGIVVTARRTEENLQDVPVAVTAIGGETLDNFQIDTFADVVTRVPGLNVQVGGSGSGGQLSLRGVGSSNISSAFDSAVAFNFDGVQLSDMRLLQTGFVDISQIEILRGPQSLFFGKSASAGVFSVRSADPTSSTEVGGRISYEFEEEAIIGSAHVSGPLSDTLGFRLATQFLSAGNVIENSAPRAVNQTRGEESFILRGTLEYSPSDRFDANLKVNYSHYENDGAIQHSDILCGTPGTPSLSNYPATLAIFNLPGVPPGYDCNAFDGRFFRPDQEIPGGGFVPAFGGAPSNNNGVPYTDTDILFARLLMNWEIADGLTLTSTTGYVDQSSDHMDIYGYAEPGGGAGISTNAREQFSQELRLTSDFDSPFNFMVGALYEDREIFFATHQYAFGGAAIFGPDPITGFTSDWVKRHVTNAETWSVFASATVDLTDQLQLSGGVRYTDESKTNNIVVPYVHAFLTGAFGFVPSGFTTPDINFSDSNWSPEVSLRYEFNPDISVYAAFKTGFKGGGIDESALPSAGLQAAVLANDFSGLIYQSETSLGGEVGIRTILANGALRFNATAFHYVFSDLQVQNFDATTIQFETLNAGELTSQGIEIDWAWQTPVEGLSLSGAAALLDTQFTEMFDTGSDDLNGRAAARAPDFTFNVAADWVIPINDNFELALRGNAQFSDSYFTNEDTLTNDYVQPSYWNFDLAASIGHPDGDWRVSLIANNIGNELWVNTSGGRPFAYPGAPEDIVVTQNRGRQVFLELSVLFD
jgi:iron complex outermembrane receptor protein